MPKSAFLRAVSDLQFLDSVVKDKLILRSERSVKSFEDAGSVGVVFAPNLQIQTVVGGIGHSELKPLYIQSKALSVSANTGTANKPDGIYIYNINSENQPLIVQSANNLQGNIFLRATGPLEIGSTSANNGTLRVVSDGGPLTVRPNSVIRSTGFSTMLQVLEGRANGSLITIGEGSQIIAEGNPALNRVSIVTGPMTGLVLPLLVHEDGSTALQNTTVVGNPYISLPNGTRHFLSIGVNDTGGVDTSNGAPNTISGNLSAVIIFAGATSGNQGTGEAAIKLMGGVTIRSGNPLSIGDLILLERKSAPAIPLLPRNVPELPPPSLLLPSPPPDNGVVSLLDDDSNTLKPVAFVQSGITTMMVKWSSLSASVLATRETFIRQNAQIIELSKTGSCTIEAKEDLELQAGGYIFMLKAGTICFVDYRSSYIHFYVLHDEEKNSVVISHNGDKICLLNAGQEFSSGSTRLDRTGRRRISQVNNFKESETAQTSELSLLSVLGHSSLLRSLLVSESGDKEHNDVRKRILKTHAALSVVTARHGAFDGRSE